MRFLNLKKPFFNDFSVQTAENVKNTKKFFDYISETYLAPKKNSPLKFEDMTWVSPTSNKPWRYSSDDLEAALDKLLVTEQGISCTAVTEEYDIPEAILRHHKKMRLEGHTNNFNRKPLGLTGKRYLTDAEEQIMGNHINQSLPWQ